MNNLNKVTSINKSERNVLIFIIALLFDSQVFCINTVS